MGDKELCLGHITLEVSDKVVNGNDKEKSGLEMSVWPLSVSMVVKFPWMRKFGEGDC